MTLTDTIGGRLAATFAARGFAEPGVAALREAAGVSLRTLYRHFPSREAMVAGALDARHAAYLAWLEEGRPDESGLTPVAHVFNRLATWMATHAPTGCLCVQALAAHPGNATIGAAVRRHKAKTRDLLAARCEAGGYAYPALPDALFILHEGQTAASVTAGPEMAHHATIGLLRPLLEPLTPEASR